MNNGEHFLFFPQKISGPKTTSLAPFKSHKKCKPEQIFFRGKTIELLKAVKGIKNRTEEDVKSKR